MLQRLYRRVFVARGVGVRDDGADGFDRASFDRFLRRSHILGILSILGNISNISILGIHCSTRRSSRKRRWPFRPLRLARSQPCHAASMRRLDRLRCHRQQLRLQLRLR